MRDLKVTSNEEAKQAGWSLIVPFPGELVGKAVYDTPHLSIMKSTKRFAVPGGFIYNTSTEIHKGTQVAVAEALVFVPIPEGLGIGKETTSPPAEEPPPPDAPGA